MAQFNPEEYLSKVGSADYLEVKWRLVWLRDTHPDAVIETEHIIITEKFAVFKAVVTLPTGARGAGHGSETPQDFREFIEKAETKAIGRALASLGFGTQFCGDELDEGVRPDGRAALADSPVQRTANRRPAAPPPPRPAAPAAADASPVPRKTYPVKPGNKPASESQVNWIASMVVELGLTDESGGVDDDQFYGLLGNEGDAGTFEGEYISWPIITTGQASALIDFLKDRIAARKAVAA